MSHAALTDAGEDQPDASVQADGTATEATTEDSPGKGGLVERLRRTPIELVILAVLAAVTRFARLYNPREIVFDEVLFRDWALRYKAAAYYFDVHPPLGKLLLGAWGAITGVDGTIANTDPSVAMRILPAFAGTLLIIVVYVLIRQLCGSRRVATLGAGLLLLDNALLVESRFILMDSMLLLFGISAVVVALAARQRTGPAYWWLLAASAALAGCAFATKVSGLSVFGLIGLIWLADVVRERRSWRPVLGQAAVLVLVPATLFVAVFAVHFALLTKTGGSNYDSSMPIEFQATLEGNPAYKPDAKRSFPQKFVDLNKAMQDGQLSMSTATHPYSSKWWSWPIMKRGVYVYFKQVAPGKARYIYTLGNPAVWWGNLVGALIVLIGMLVVPRRFAPYKWPLIFLAIGWASNYLPFALIDRPMFLYHYLFALIFSTAFVCVGLGALTGWIKEEEGKPWSFPSRWSAAGYWAVLGVALLGFVYFAPLTYGLPLTDEAMKARMWLSTWR